MNRAECDRCGETFPASCLVLIPGSDDVVCKYCLNKYRRMHRGWRIEYDPMPFPGAFYHWFHPDADGAPDAAQIAENEGGYASTVAEAMADIDETIDQYRPREEQPCEVCGGDDPKCPECTMYWENRHHEREAL